MALRDALRDHPVAAFFGLTFLISWAAWLPLLVAGGLTNAWGIPLFLIGGFGPAIAAGVVTWSRRDGLRAWLGQLLTWRVAPRYWLAALGFPASAVVLASLVHLGVGEVIVFPDRDALVRYLPGMLFVFVAGGGNEEPGWRGFALPRLQAHYSALSSSLIIGAGWVVWHVPLFVLPGSSQAGLPFPFWALGVFAVSIVLTWLYNSTSGSVLLAMVLHASVNNASVFYLAGGSASVTTPLGYGLFAGVLTVIALVLVVIHGPDTLAAGPIPRGPP